MKAVKTKQIVRYVAAICAVLLMFMIFCFSADDATTSTKKSDSVIEKIAAFLVPGFENYTEQEKAEFCDLFSGIVRTGAHCAVFAALGFFVSTTFSTFEKPAFYLKIIFSELFCVLYSLSDEIHQLSSPGRAFELVDVLCDSLGALFGIGVAFLLYCLIIGKCRKTKKQL